MSLPLPIERVVRLLTHNGYSLRYSPVTIGSVTFDFSAVLTGNRSTDLVVIVDLIEEPSQNRVLQRLEALSTALDLVGSRKALTVVLVGPHPRPATIEAIARIARVVDIGSHPDHDETSLRDCLAILLPLELPDVSKQSTRHWDAEQERLRQRDQSKLALAILAASRRGSSAVSVAVREYIEAPLIERGEDA